ncbi:MAG: DNA mismatch repair endonuclease MutL, partial [Candidatus Hodarchaeales archaeon]
MKGEFPMIFLFIDFDPQNYDVNIHPQKREVLFYNENNIKKAVSTAINHCLKTQNLVPEFISSSTKKKQAQLNF